jgi:hypothetical protein
MKENNLSQQVGDLLIGNLPLFSPCGQPNVIPVTRGLASKKVSITTNNKIINLLRTQF